MLMEYAVFLTDDAARDLEDIYDYITGHDGPGRSDHVIARIEDALASLSELPERGACPRELSNLGIRLYCEIFFKPFRIIYTIIDRNVYVLLIADGRRDMQTLLYRRILDSR